MQLEESCVWSVRSSLYNNTPKNVKQFIFISYNITQQLDTLNITHENKSN